MGSCGGSENQLLKRAQHSKIPLSVNDLGIFEDFARRKACLLELLFPSSLTETSTTCPSPIFLLRHQPPTCRYKPLVAVSHVPSSNKLRLPPQRLNSPLWLKSPQRLLMAPSHPQKPTMRMPVVWLPPMKTTSQCFTMPKTSTSSIHSCINGLYGSPSHQVERFVHPLRSVG